MNTYFYSCLLQRTPYAKRFYPLQKSYYYYDLNAEKEFSSY